MALAKAMEAVGSVFFYFSSPGGRDRHGDDSTGASAMKRRDQGRTGPGCVGPARGGLPAGGFTMIELMLVMTVLLVAFGALSQSLVQSMALTEVNRESALAQGAMREMIEVMNGSDSETEDFALIFSRYNSDPTDDPPGVSSPGSNFAVAGLTPIDGDPDGFVGEIIFPTLVTGAGLELREDITLPELGMPRDLDGDGQWLMANNVESDYRLLPVLIRVEWQGRSGGRSAEIRTFLAER